MAVDFKAVAEQLRKPDGEFGKQVAGNMNVSNALLYTRAIQQLAPGSGDNILEIGMANGFFVKDILAAAENLRYTGCDFSETMIQESKELNKEWMESGKVHFLLTSADSLLFKDNTFDKALVVNVIYFWTEPAKELREIRRVLKKGGRLVIGMRPKASMSTYPFTAHGFRMYERKEVAELLGANGFQVLNAQQQEEPDQQLSGRTIAVESLVISAEVIK